MAEPNNNIAGAQTFNLETIYKDNVASDSDVDYFKISPVSTPSQLTIDFTGLDTTTSNNEFNISIRDGSDGVIASKVLGISNSTADLQVALPKDTTYYLRVAKGGSTSTKEYSVKGSVVATAEAAGEKNGNDNITNINSATKLVPNADFTGYLGTSSAANGSDIDHYSFTTGTVIGKTVKVDVSSFAKDADFYTASIVDKNGSVIKYNSKAVQATVGTTQKQTLEFKVSESDGSTPVGTYFVKINAINASNFESSSEKTKPYTIKVYGETDYNEAPSVYISGTKSGLYGTATVENTTAKTVTKSASVNLSTFITTTDPDTDTNNKTILDYYIGLVDSNDKNTSGKITYTADSDSSTKTLTSKADSSKTGLLNKLSAAEFATAKYVGAGADEVGEQAIYALVLDSSTIGADGKAGTADDVSVPDAIKTSGMVFQKVDTRDISVSVSSSHGGATPNKALKEGQKDASGTDGTNFQTLTFSLTGGKAGVAVSVVVTPVDGELELDSTQAPNNTVVLTPGGGQTTASKTVKVWAKSDGKADAGKEKLTFTTNSSDATYKGLTVADMTFDVSEVKAEFAVSNIVYGAADGISEAATVTAGSALAIKGDLAANDKVVFTSPHKVIITSVADESTRSFKVIGTDKDGTAAKEDIIKGADKGVATGVVEYRSIDSITLVTGNGNTAGKVHAGIASLLEGDAKAGTKEATYTITASEFPAGKTISVGMSSPDLTITTGSTSNPSHDFTDNGSVTVKVVAKQDGLDEGNPEEAVITTVITVDGKVEALYSGAISAIKVNVEDSNKPVGADSVVTGEKDKDITFKAGDFGYSDPDGNPLNKITITEVTIAANASLKNKAGADVKKDDVILFADLDDLVFKPEAGKGGVNYSSFKYKVNDGAEDAAAASTMKINIGKSVALNVKYSADTSKVVKSTTITTLVNAKDKNNSDPSDDSPQGGGPFKTDADGKLDLTGVPNGHYYGGFKAATDATTVANIKKSVNINDVMVVLKDIGNIVKLSNSAKVGADINSDRAVDINDIMETLKIIGGIKQHSDYAMQFVLRDNDQSDPFTNTTFEIESPSSLTLNAHLLGDADGNYKDFIA